MKLIIKQKIISWFDSYNVYDANDNIVFIIKGKLAWRHKFIIYDVSGNELGYIKQKVMSWLTTFEVYNKETKIGQIKRKFSWFKPKYTFDLGNYEVEGNIWGLTYNIKKGNKTIAHINKKLWSITDTYTIETSEKESLNVIMIVLAIDADNCNQTDDD